ncbi:MAG: lysophospholipid acyltransferase family protein [Rikenellaceae bacterium]
MVTIIYTVVLISFFLSFFPFFTLFWIIGKCFDKSGKLIQGVSRVLSYVIIRLWPFWRVKVNGLENIDKSKTYIIVCNHQSMFDIPIMAYIPLNFRWVAKREVYKIPFIGWVTWMRGDIGIERGGLSSTKKMLKTARKYVANKISLVIYAEGTRSKTGKMNQFKEGAFIVAKTTGKDILPVVIDGTWSLANDSKFGLKCSAKMTLTVLESIPAEQIRKMDIKEISDTVKDRIETTYIANGGVGY